MSDSEEKPVAPSFNWHGIAIDTWKVKHPSFFEMAIPPEFFPTIGLIATSWGRFEVLFDNFLAALAKANGDVWRNLTFRKRRNWFGDEEAKTFAAAPAILGALKMILNDSEPIYIKRNLVVHGQLAAYFEAGKPGQVALQCVGRYRGREIQETFAWDQLDDLFYEIGHLSGRLNLLSTNPEKGLSLSLSDRSLLQAFLEKNHPTYPNSHMQPAQPQSSAE